MRYLKSKRIAQRASWTVAILAAALILPEATSAQIFTPYRPPEPRFASAWNLTVGSGAEYRVHCRFAYSCFLTISVIGKTQVKGNPAYWIEISSRREGASVGLVSKLLLSLRRKKGKRSRAAFLRGVAQVPGRPPMILPDSWLQPWAHGFFQTAVGYLPPPIDGVSTILRIPYGRASTGRVWRWAVPGRTYYYDYFYSLAPNWWRHPPGVSRAGSEIVKTPAGTFAATRWKYKGKRGDVWIAKGAGPFGVVRAEGPTISYSVNAMAEVEGLLVPEAYFRAAKKDPNAPWSAMVLTRVMTDAKDQITGAPASPTDATKLWHWLWEERKQLLPVCLPQLGLPWVWN